MEPRPSHAHFAPTRWSLVRAARQGDEQGRGALAELCAAYWAPVYAFFRRDGMPNADARDLTQGLFAELLERGDIAGGDPGKGRFRSYLLACARHYRSNVRDRERAQKRGGGQAHLPIMVRESDGEAPVGIEPAHNDTPEQAYVRCWVGEAIALALADLEREEQEKGHAAQFARLRGALEGDGAGAAYAAIATELQTTEAAIKVAVHRLRRRFRTALLRQLGATVENPADAEAELADLFAALQ